VCAGAMKAILLIDNTACTRYCACVDSCPSVRARCASNNVIVLNLMRIRGTIKEKRIENGSWIWWIEDKEESK